MRVFLTGLSVSMIVFVLVLSIGYAVSQTVEVERFDFTDKNPVAVAVVGDLHYPHSYLSLNETAAMIEETTPDVVVFTGDVADAGASERDVAALYTFFLRLCERFSCYAVIGNHEIGSEHLAFYVKTAESAGVKVLLNECAVERIKGREIAFFGLSDGYPYKEGTFGDIPTAQTKILLSHRPEKLDEYAHAPDSIRPDYVFCGHAHGGVARMGKLALYAPDQGLFPKYTSGLYEENGVKMVVTRGMGISSVDFRCFNKYHLPIVKI